MKRILPFLTAVFLVVTTFSFSGCGSVDRDSELKELLKANEDSLSDTFKEEECEYSLFSDYIKSWAKSSDMNVAYAGDHSTVLLNKATEGYDEEPSTALLCNFDTDNAPSSLHAVATSMTSLFGPTEHGDIYLIVTELSDDMFVGINEVPVKYLNCDNLINLQTASDDTILTRGSNHAICTFYKNGSTTEPNYMNAYEITMSIPEHTDPYNFSSGKDYPNPINVIGNFLATSMSSGRLFDIASFSSDTKNGYTPYTATAVIVVSDNHVENFQNRFEKSYKTMEDKFDKLDDDFVYTMTETDVPDQVLSEEISNNVISLMYTLNTGICVQDENTGIINAASYIKSIQTDGGNLDLSIDIRTRGESYLDNLSSEYETTAGLCSTKYSCTNLGIVWESDKDSDMVTFFTERVPLMSESESNISIKNYENDIIAKRLPDQNMIIYTFDKGNRKSVLSDLVEFMDPEYEKQF